MWRIKNGKAYDMGFGEDYEFEDGDEVLPKELLDRMRALKPINMRSPYDAVAYAEHTAIDKETEKWEKEHNTTVLFGRPTSLPEGKLGIS